MEEKLRSPCFDCDRVQENKNNPTCENCKKRIAYLVQSGSLSSFDNFKLATVQSIKKPKAEKPIVVKPKTKKPIVVKPITEKGEVAMTEEEKDKEKESDVFIEQNTKFLQQIAKDIAGSIGSDGGVIFNIIGQVNVSNNTQTPSSNNLLPSGQHPRLEEGSVSPELKGLIKDTEVEFIKSETKGIPTQKVSVPEEVYSQLYRVLQALPSDERLGCLLGLAFDVASRKSNNGSEAAEFLGVSYAFAYPRLRKLGLIKKSYHKERSDI